MNKNIKKQLNEIFTKQTFLIVSPAEHMTENTNKITEYLVKDKHLTCIYVSINKPSKTIKAELIKKRKLNAKKFYFVDAITSAVTEPTEVKNTLYVSNPSDLDGIASSIGQLAPIIGEDGFIIVDAMRTLLIYNSEQKISKFVESLILLEKKYRIKVLFMTTEGKGRSLINKVNRYFEKVIELK